MQCHSIRFSFRGSHLEMPAIGTGGFWADSVRWREVERSGSGRQRTFVRQAQLYHQPLQCIESVHRFLIARKSSWLTLIPSAHLDVPLSYFRSGYQGALDRLRNTRCCTGQATEVGLFAVLLVIVHSTPRHVNERMSASKSYTIAYLPHK